MKFVIHIKGKKKKIKRWNFKIKNNKKLYYIVTL